MREPQGADRGAKLALLRSDIVTSAPPSLQNYMMMAALNPTIYGLPQLTMIIVFLHSCCFLVAAIIHV